MFSFPLFERLKAETPEFEQVAAFQAGGARLERAAAGRGRRGAAAAVRVRHRQLFPDARRRRVRRPRAHAGRRRPSAPPVVVLSHHAWDSALRRRPSVVGATFVIEGHPFTVIGVAPPGFFGETLRGNPPDLWIPLQQEPLHRRRQLAAAPAGVGVAARDRPAAAGRLGRRHGAAADRRPARSGCSTTPAIPPTGCRTSSALLPKQTIAVVPAGAGVGRDEGAVQPQAADPARRLRPGAAHRLRERRQPAAGAGGGAPDADGDAAGDRRLARADRHAGAGRERAAGDRRRHRRAAGRGRRRAAAARAGVHQRAVPADQHAAVAARAGVRVRPGAADRASSSARRRRGWPRGPIRSRRCAAPAAAPAITRRSRARRC